MAEPNPELQLACSTMAEPNPEYDDILVDIAGFFLSHENDENAQYDEILVDIAGFFLSHENDENEQYDEILVDIAGFFLSHENDENEQHDENLTQEERLAIVLSRLAIEKKNKGKKEKRVIRGESAKRSRLIQAVRKKDVVTKNHENQTYTK